MITEEPSFPEMEPGSPAAGRICSDPTPEGPTSHSSDSPLPLLEPTLRELDYDSNDIALVRSALKLGTKIVSRRPSDGPTSSQDVLDIDAEDLRSPGCLQPAFNGLLFAMLNRPAEEIVAACLAPAMTRSVELGTEDRALRAFMRKYPPEAINFLDELTSGQTVEAPIYLKDEITRTLLFAEDCYGAKVRKWGPYESIPIIHHAAETGILLAMSHSDWPTVQSGILHDSIEDRPKDLSHGDMIERLNDNFSYFVASVIQSVSEDRDPSTFLKQLEHSNLLGDEASTVESFIQTLDRHLPQFTERARELYGQLSPEDDAKDLKWAARKSLVMALVLSLSDIDPEKAEAAAKVCCAAKTSTMAAGNKYLWIASDSAPLEEAVSGWSTGRYELNVLHWQILEAIFAHHGVDQLLIDQFSHERKRFEGFGQTSS